MAQNVSDTDSALTETTQDQDAREHEAAETKANELLASSDLPEGTKKVSLTQALQLAQKRNLRLKQMNLEFEKSDARLHQARALLLPVAQAEVRCIMADHADEMNMAEGMQGLLDELGQMLSGIPGYTPPADGGAAGSENVVINPRHTVNGSVTVSVPLVNLSNWRNYHLARSGNQLTALSVEEVRQNVLYGTAQAYFMALMSTTLVIYSRAVKRQYELEIENLEQSVGQQVRQAKREHETALTNVRGARRRVKLAQESLQLAEAAYAAGAGTSLDVTDARRMYLQAGVNLATTELKTQLTLLALLKSIGEKPANLVK